MAARPSVVIVLCGKRKSGKDYVAARLEELLGEVSVVRLSRPLKEQYAKDHGLDVVRLMDSSNYKETHRRAMIDWGEKMRERDSEYFCRLAVQSADKPVWLVCDARRPTDMEFFKAHYRCTTVRVVASEGVRVERGWVFVEGVDNAPSECALDDYQCDITVRNEGPGILAALQGLKEHVQQLIKS